MKIRPDIHRIKLFIKISIVVFVLATFVILGFFMRPVTSFENASMKKWSTLDDAQKNATIDLIVKDSVEAIEAEQQGLLVKCIDKISVLPDSQTMQIRGAVSLCYNAIKLNSDSHEE